MRTYLLRLSGGLTSRILLAKEEGNITTIVRRVRRGVWLTDTDGEKINPAHVISVRRG